MKNLKKLASVALALVMTMALMVPAFAAEPTGSITVTKPDGVDEKATYKVYEVFSLTRATGATETSGYAYTATTAIKDLILGASDDYTAVANYFTFTRVGSTDVWNVAPAESYNDAAAKNFSKFLAAHVTSLGDPVKTVEVAGDATSETIEGLEYGYYFVDSTVGTLCMLSSSTPDVTITDKNTQPTIDKTITMEDQDRIGTDVEYTIEVEVKEGAKDYIVSDVMSNGLTYKNDLSVKCNGTDVAYTPQTTMTAPEGKTEIFRIAIDNNFLAANAGKKIVITYSATINSNAVAVNGNTATLDYGNGHQVDTSTKSEQPDAKLWSFELNKVNGDADNAPLDGAKFKLYDAAENGNEIKVAVSTNSDYDYDYVVTTGEGVEIEAGSVKIFGLGNGTYYLEETEAPQGFNKLTERKAFTINNANLEVATDSAVVVENNSGAVLPSTGGMGTTIFYVVGGVLLVGSAILFVTKKRMGE